MNPLILIIPIATGAALLFGPKNNIKEGDVVSIKPRYDGRYKDVSSDDLLTVTKVSTSKIKARYIASESRKFLCAILPRHVVVRVREEMLT